MKNVVITGSRRGIGYQLAKEFLRMNCNVTLSSRSESLTIESKHELDAYQDHFIYVVCDVRSPESIQDLWDRSVQKWGSVDIWINNAGINSQHDFTWEIGFEDTKSVLETNLIGMIYGSQIAAREMNKQGYGAIYSMEGLGSNNMIQSKTIHYGTSKHALTYYMRGLAKELKNTSVIAGRLSPGMMLTDFITRDKQGDSANVLNSTSFTRLFNILGDKPETVAKYFVPKILNNQKNDAHFVWLTNTKTMFRFIQSIFVKRKLI